MQHSYKFITKLKMEQITKNKKEFGKFYCMGYYKFGQVHQRYLHYPLAYRLSISKTLDGRKLFCRYLTNIHILHTSIKLFTTLLTAKHLISIVHLATYLYGYIFVHIAHILQKCRFLSKIMPIQNQNVSTKLYNDIRKRKY